MLELHIGHTLGVKNNIKIANIYVQHVVTYPPICIPSLLKFA
jgi:hypothetical protein